MLPQSDIDRKFDFKPASEERLKIHHGIRALCKEAAETLNELVPDGPEKNLMFVHLEQSMMWANKGVANADRGPGDQ